MLRMIVLVLIGMLLTSCSIFRVHKMDIEQGNIIKPEMVQQLHRGMTEAEVREKLGNPVLVNVFNDNQLVYVYTMQPGHQEMREQQVLVNFNNGVLETFSTTVK